MTKRKGRFEGTVHFLSNLPIEECMARLQALEGEDFTIAFWDETGDSIAFKACTLERGIVRAEGKGSLQRWEGTLTRVDCDVKVREGVLRWLMLLTMLFLVTMVALPILFFLVAGINIMVWVAISIGFLALMATIMFMLHHYAPLDDTPQNLLHILTSALDD